MPDILFILLLALVIFGPKKLPEIARQIAKYVIQFRQMSNDFKRQLESEMLKIELEEKRRRRNLQSSQQPILPPPANLCRKLLPPERCDFAERPRVHFSAAGDRVLSRHSYRETGCVLSHAPPQRGIVRMSLSLDSRHCGRVFVIKCAGRIVTGEEITILEACITRGLLESTRIVLQAGEVTRVDSTGMGLLVRFLSHTRNRGGDLRLAACPPFLTNLLQLTKLTTIFRIYDSEDEAIVSFLKEPALFHPTGAQPGPLVLFVDQSPDLCAFVRTLLQHHGYEVLSTCRMHDAKTLLSAAKSTTSSSVQTALPCRRTAWRLR